MYDSPPDCMQKLRNIQMQVLFCLIHDDWLSTKSDCISDCIPVFLSSMSNTSLASTLLRLSAVEPTFHETCPQKTWIAILLKPCQQKNFEIKCVCSYRFRYIWRHKCSQWHITEKGWTTDLEKIDCSGHVVYCCGQWSQPPAPTVHLTPTYPVFFSRTPSWAESSTLSNECPVEYGIPRQRVTRALLRANV